MSGPSDVALRCEPLPLASPLAVLAWGVTAATGVLLGVPMAVALTLGGLVWAAIVLRKWTAPPRWDQPGPWRLAEPWRTPVLDAIASARDFHDIAMATRPGAVRDALVAFEPRVVDAAREAWAVALLGAALGDEFRRLTHRRHLGRGEGQPDAGALGTVDARAVVLEGARSVSERLLLLDARFGEAIARTAELSVSATSDIAEGSDAIVEVLDELKALRAALEEVDDLGQRAGG